MKFDQCKIFILMIFLFFLGAKQSYASKAAPWVGVTFSEAPCRGAGQGYGPYDYTQRNSIPKHHLHIVEKGHFTPQVANLIRGESTTNLAGDIGYTLRAWPNHHRALDSLSRYQIRLKYSSRKNYKPKLSTPIECYFQRAMNFSPRDATTRMLYGIYLHKIKYLKMADKEYAKAIKLSPRNPVIRYNYGLLLVDLKKYDLAQKQAVIAYEAGFPLNGLKNKLAKIKRWPPKSTVKTDSNSDVNKANKTPQQ